MFLVQNKETMYNCMLLLLLGTSHTSYIKLLSVCRTLIKNFIIFSALLQCQFPFMTYILNEKNEQTFNIN